MFLKIINSMYKIWWSYRVPININIFWNFEILSFIFLFTQILTGIFLATYYVLNFELAFNSIEVLICLANEEDLLTKLRQVKWPLARVRSFVPWLQRTSLEKFVTHSKELAPIFSMYLFSDAHYSNTDIRSLKDINSGALYASLVNSLLVDILKTIKIHKGNFNDIQFQDEIRLKGSFLDILLKLIENLDANDKAIFFQKYYQYELKSVEDAFFIQITFLTKQNYFPRGVTISLIENFQQIIRSDK